MDPRIRGRQGEFERIIASLHRAMLDESEWHTTLALIDDACGTAGLRLVVVDDNDPNDAQWLFGDACCRHAELAQQHFDREPITAPTRNELLRRARADGLNIRAAGPDGTHTLWALARPATARGLNPEQIAMVKRLLPHLHQFLRVRHALAGDAALGASLSRVLDNMLIGVLYLDWRGMIVQANARARDLLSDGQFLLHRDGYLHARTADDDRRLQRILAQALPGSSRPGNDCSISFAQASKGPRIALHLTPVDRGLAGLGFGRVAVLALLVDPMARRNVDPDQVAATLGLSPAEARVAVALAAGASMREVANATQRAQSTVHELLKRIHAKLGISRRADLVRMVLSMPGLPSVSSGEAPVIAVPGESQTELPAAGGS